MEQEAKQQFQQHQVLRGGARMYGISPDDLTFIGAWQNFIYEYQIDGISYILRFTPSTHRSENAVQGELDWIMYLSRNDVSVAEPIPSQRHHWTEVVSAGDMYFTAASFVKAPGRKIGYPECLSDIRLYEKLGMVTGRIHALSKMYAPQNESIRRHDWFQNYYLTHVEKFVPSNQPQVHESCRRLIDEIHNTLTKNKHDYGLIHGDIGVGNYTVIDDYSITLFDFDEAQYSWFIEDIAIPLYYLIYVYGGDDGKQNRESQTSLFLEHFLRGYQHEHHFEERWLRWLPLFLRLREIIVYTGMYRSMDLSDPNQDQWTKDYLAESKHRIENGIPIVDIW